MKKTLTLALSVLLVMALAIPSFAGFVQEEAYYEIAFGVQKAATEWKPDGEYTPGEYWDIEMNPAWFSAAFNTDSNQDAALALENYKIALSWDETYFYIYAQVNDTNGHDNTYGADPGNMWQAGAMQICLADEDQMGESRLEYGIGLTSDTNELITVNWADYLASGFTAKAGEDFIVTVDGDVVTYEARTPNTAFTTIPAAEGAVYSICLVLSWGNGTDYIHTQLAEGCTGNGKDAGAFAMVTLEPAGEVPAPAEEPAPVEEPAAEAPAAEVVEAAPAPEVVEVVEEPAAAVVVETAPQTFDMGIIAAIAAVVSAAGYTLTKKR